MMYWNVDYGLLGGSCVLIKDVLDLLYLSCSSH